MLSADRLARLEDFLIELNTASAQVILPLFRADHGLEDKNADGPKAFDPVTAADRGAETAIRALLTQRFPDHGVIGEEYGEDRPDSEFVWVIDPVDGTRAFIAGLPLWTTLIGLRYQGEPVLGSIGQPYLGEIFIGHAGAARRISRAGTTRLAVRRGLPMAQAIIATTDPHLCFTAREMDAWNAVRAAVRLARLGCDAYAYAMVASGTMDLVIESDLKSWDIEAAIPLLAGSGGRVTNWRGEPVGRHGGQVIVAGDEALLNAALAHLGPAAA